MQGNFGSYRAPGSFRGKCATCPGRDHSPVALAMISFDTLAGTSAYESNTME
ncbi:Uncharacterised protein [Mycobacteroides abscessus subsp. abscessus]|nr:Uncharacterised protein [Mycobacteroides abscessus subsp. abscessus]